VNYLECCNEVLVRMREDEIDNVKDKDNEPQQKLVTRFVKDAYSFVQKSHTWNSSRRIWTVGLQQNEAVYPLGVQAGQAQIYSIRYGMTEQQLIEVTQPDLARRRQKHGKPVYFAPSQMTNGNLAIQVHPTPDENYTGNAGEASLYGVAEYTVALYNGGLSHDKQLVVEGYKMSSVPVENADIIELPDQVVLYYALALASRERGEVGGQSSQELFGLSRSYMSDAISWDVSNSRGEYLWEAI